MKFDSKVKLFQKNGKSPNKQQVRKLDVLAKRMPSRIDIPKIIDRAIKR